jgi:uncharacterized protein YcbX
MSAPRVASLHVYPLKSAGGIALPSVEVDETGLRHDRRWMIVDARNRFLTQRSHARMALLRTALTSDRLRVTAPAMDPLELPLGDPDPGAPHELIPVWDKERYAISCGSDAAAWASAFLGIECRMVQTLNPNGESRMGVRETVRAGFADAFPALMISAASLADLNARLDEPLPMNRFRPNVVVEGVAPYAEDDFTRVRLGELAAVFRKKCIRCAITTTDQETGRRGVEPLRTLATYRRVPDGEVAFGVNVGFESAGVLRVGDALS